LIIKELVMKIGVKKKIISNVAEDLKIKEDIDYITSVVSHLDETFFMPFVRVYNDSSYCSFKGSSVKDFHQYLCENLAFWNNTIKTSLAEMFTTKLRNLIAGDTDSFVPEMSKPGLELLKRKYKIEQSEIELVQKLVFEEDGDSLSDAEAMVEIIAIHKFKGAYSASEIGESVRPDIISLGAAIDLCESLSVTARYRAPEPLKPRTDFNATSLLELEPRILGLTHAPNNLGASCFLNSILQAVTLLPAIIEAADPTRNVLTKQQNRSERIEYGNVYISDTETAGILEEFSREESTSELEKRQDVQREFHNVLNEMYNPTKSMPHLMNAIRNLWHAIQAQQPALGGFNSQQDSVWALTAILDSLNILGPQHTVMTSVEETPKLCSVRTELTLPIIRGSIIPKNEKEPICTVQEIVRQYHVPDLMTGEDQYMHCGEKIDAHKAQILAEEPPFIAVQLKRYKTVGEGLGRRQERIHDAVEPSASIIVPIYGKDPIEKQLVGISCQIGGLGGGHYTAYRQAPDGNIYSYDDSFCSASLGTKWDELPERDLAFIRQNSYLLTYQ
jgi:hypothetical protein